ncbi:MAG: murein biosynthesis integral membrane protein MurJ [Lentisphaerae bacterium]|nr:murein biosynthesis integral membrane protein MurJ [Lentisphaerota bacterium]
MDNQGVIRSAGRVSFFILVSRAFGLIRDMAMAALFGSSLAMDAFVVAFTIPNLFRNLFGEGALSAAFVPVFTETLEKQGRDVVWRFAQKMMSLLGLTLAGLVLAGILAAGAWQMLFPLSPRGTLILVLLQIMLPYMFFICLAAYFSAMLNTLRHFALPASTPVILNLVMIAVLFLVCPLLEAEGRLRIVVVAWSVVLAGAAQWLIQLPLLWRYGFRLRLSFDWHDTRVRRVIQLMSIAIIGTGMTQISVLLDRFVAIFLGPGSASYLYYAERLIYFPLGLFATALGTVLLPTFSGHAAQARTDRIRETLNQALRQLMFIMLPAAVGLMALAQPIVRLLYERGDFAPQATAMTALAVQCYAPGLLIFSLLKVLVPVFHAHQDMRTPMRISVACTGFNMVLKLFLILVWQWRPFAYAHAFVAAATVLASAVAVLALGLLAQRRWGSCGWRTIGLASVKMLAAALIMAVAARTVYQNILTNSWLAAGAWQAQLLAILGALGTGIVVYGSLAMLGRFPEVYEFWQAIRHRRQPEQAAQ